MKLISIFTLFLSLFLSLNTSAAEQMSFGAERHANKGVACQSCHGADPMANDLPTEQNCVACHNKASLALRTKDVKPQNPHAAPHNNDCAACHRQHEPAVNYCNQCHQFDFKVK